MFYTSPKGIIKDTHIRYKTHYFYSVGEESVRHQEQWKEKVKEIIYNIKHFIKYISLALFLWFLSQVCTVMKISNTFKELQFRKKNHQNYCALLKYFPI